MIATGVPLERGLRIITGDLGPSRLNSSPYRQLSLFPQLRGEKHQKLWSHMHEGLCASGDDINKLRPEKELAASVFEGNPARRGCDPPMQGKLVWIRQRIDN